MSNNGNKKRASMLRSYACLVQGLGRKLYLSRWGLHDNGKDVGEIEIRVKVNKKGEITVLPPAYTPKEV